MNDLQVGIKKKIYQSQSKRPCSFYMEGHCRRFDCKFSHDLSSITCRFWEEGSCFKGLNCPFLHGYPVAGEPMIGNEALNSHHHNGGSVNSNTLIPIAHLFEERKKKKKKFALESEADFPTLGQGNHNSSKGIRNQKTRNLTISKRGKKKKLRGKERKDVNVR